MTHQTSKPRWTGVDRKRPPHGTLQDAGEIEVLAPSTGATRHRFAMVIAFDSEESLRQAMKDHRCAYRDSQRVQELNHG